MGQESHSDNVDNMLSEFLSELNALSDSIGAASTTPAPTASEAGEPIGAPVAAPEEVHAEPASETIAPEPATPNPVHYRNIDILLMDDLDSTSSRTSVEHDEMFHTYRALYQSRFRPGRRAFRMLAWAAAAVGVICLIGILYFIFGARPGSLHALRSSSVDSAANRGSITPAVAIDQIVPRYPAKARRLRIRGVVQLEVDVNEKGKAMNAVALSGPDVLRAAAIQAVLKCRFRPARQDGIDVRSTVKISVPFNP